MYAPLPIKQDGPLSLADYLEAMSRAVFTSGISWRVIDAKWDGIREAFGGFDAEKIAAYTPDDVDRLMADPRVIRNRKKIEAIVGNARELIATGREFGGIDTYLKSFAHNDDLIRDLHKRFAFLGESVAHFFLFYAGFNLSEQDKWARAHFGDEAYAHHHHFHR